MDQQSIPCEKCGYFDKNLCGCERKGGLRMDDKLFFEVVMSHPDYSNGYVKFIVKASTAREALYYTESKKKGTVIEISPTEYFDFIDVSLEKEDSEKNK